MDAQFIDRDDAVTHLADHGFLSIVHRFPNRRTPPGFEIVYWLVTPARLTDALPHVGSPSGPAKPLTLLPRCDDTLLKSRGDCIDNSAGPKLVPRGDPVPDNLAQAADQGRRDLLFMRQNDTAVIASTEPLTGPVIYEFRLAHR